MTIELSFPWTIVLGFKSKTILFSPSDCHTNAVDIKFDLNVVFKRFLIGFEESSL